MTVGLQKNAPVWQPREVDDDSVRKLTAGLGVSETLAKILVGRGIRDEGLAERFLSPRLADLPDPARLAGMHAAVERIVHALRHDECIGIFGDYDVDGVTSTTLLWEFLESIGGRVVATLPDRLKEGYGLSRAGVDRLRDAGSTLLVTVDCGVTAHEEVAYCTQQGVDVIVIDHHTVPVTLPDAVAVINPHRPDCESAAEHLCAVGVTYNLCLALRRELRNQGYFSTLRPEPDLRKNLDLVALGTVADVVPLVEDNRIFVHYGLRNIRSRLRLGMDALLEVAGVPMHRIGASTLGFQLGPRVNAAGRLGDAMKAVELLRSAKTEHARELANALDRENTSRRDLERRMTQEAFDEVDASQFHQESRVLVIGREDWHPGVVGIVASRVVERYGKPTVIVGEGGRGSGRSIPAYHLYDGLHFVSETLEGFGGHAHAAGVRVRAGGLEKFREALAGHAGLHLAENDLRRVWTHDGDLPVEAIDEGLCQELSRAAPYGRKNPEPLFRIPKVHPRGVRPLSGGHFKANVHPNGNVEAILFGAGERMGEFQGEVSLLGTPEINEWRGRKTVQLRLRDFQSGEQAS